MQRLFTVFPGGAPGAALLLLRLSVAGSLYLPLLESTATHLGILGITTAAALLLVGFATPLVGIATAAVQLTRILDAVHLNAPFAATAAATLWGATALAVALIGPGAFSIDARIFGRRVLASS